VSTQATKEISDWLEKLGMPEYAQRFAENDIDIAVLRHLTDQDLKELGVSLGHRRKMLAAIAQLDGTSIAEAPIPAPGILKPQPPVASTSPPTPEAAGERRHVAIAENALISVLTVVAFWLSVSSKPGENA
jgi:SAM domain (Sterile alpha motif)